EAVTPLTLADRARCFQLPNQDIVVVWRGEAAAALESRLAALRHLFAGEPELLPDPEALIALHELPRDGAALRLTAEETLRSRPPVIAPPSPGRALDGATLAVLEGALAQTDMSRFARRRPVCSLEPDGSFALRWERRSLSVDELAETLLPEHALRADPWLFRRLTRTLDRRLLALLTDPAELRFAGPFGLKLNVGSVLSPEFLRFDTALPAALRGQVVIGFDPADILADPAAFLFARDFAGARRYRLLLAGVTAELLEVMPRGQTGLHLVELRWSEALSRIDPAMVAADARHVVLGHADSAEALDWGRAAGITLYQGKVAGVAAWPGRAVG
ncbi:MAG TPA: hypothetical protein VGC80_09985, partial [Acetobacteraceae bacterium]